MITPYVAGVIWSEMGAILESVIELYVNMILVQVVYG